MRRLLAVLFAVALLAPLAVVAGCDSWTISAVSTTATLNATFNNTLSVNGFLTYRVLNNNCGPLTEH